MIDRPLLPALTGLRFLAALAVAFHHLPHLQADESIPPLLRQLLAEGFAGVPFFFVLSGFVLTYSYLDRLVTPTRAALSKYYIARVARIGPVHWLAMALTLPFPIIGAMTGGGPAVAFVTALLLQTWIPDPLYYQAYNPVAWSLAVEAWFYLWLPVILWQLGRHRWTMSRLLLLALGTWAMMFAANGWVGAHPTASRVWFVVLCPAGRFGEFLVGVMLAAIFLRAPDRSQSTQSCRTIRTWTALEVASVAATVGLVLASQQVSVVLRQTCYYIPAMAAVVYVFACNRGLLSRSLSGRVPVYLGEISYSFFMVHAIVFCILYRMRWPDAAGTWGRAGIHLVLAGVVAGLIHRYYEMPLRMWITRPGHRFRLAGFFPASILRSSIRR